MSWCCKPTRAGPTWGQEAEAGTPIPARQDGKSSLCSPKEQTLSHRTTQSREACGSTCVTRPERLRPRTGRGLAGTGALGGGVTADGDGASCHSPGILSIFCLKIYVHPVLVMRLDSRREDNGRAAETAPAGKTRLWHQRSSRPNGPVCARPVWKTRAPAHRYTVCIPHTRNRGPPASLKPWLKITRCPRRPLTVGLPGHVSLPLGFRTSPGAVRIHFALIRPQAQPESI